MSRRVLAAALAAVAFAGCGIHFSVPATRTHDARFGFLAGREPPPTRDALCSDWRGAVSDRDPYAGYHVSYPETAPELSCYTPVTYTATEIHVGATPAGCGYPNPLQRTRLREVADRLDVLGSSPPDSPTALLPCRMTAADHTATLRHNARVLRATAERAERPDGRTYPYAAVITFGYGWPDQAGSSVADWKPGDACFRPSNRDLQLLGGMVLRSRRIAESLRAGIAPIAIVSGGTEHSRMVEAFAMLYLLQCALGVREDRVLLESCAEHTHTNFRNAGRWLVALGARAAYVTTDNGVQSDYLEDYGGFEIVTGSLDQRSLRDWSYVMGSWRRAAEGPYVGFWFTPYRFWAEPRDGLGAVTCLDGRAPQDH